jgi:hypothetical protein
MVNNKISPISIKQNNHFSPQLIGHRKKTVIHEVGNPGSDYKSSPYIAFKL